MSSVESERLHLRRRVYQLLGSKSKSDVVKHFVEEKYSRRTIYSIISRCEQGLPVDDMPREGRPPKLGKRNLKKMSENRVGVTQRSLSREFGVSRGCIRYNLKKMDLKYRKRQRAPKYSEKQLEEIPKKSRKLRQKILARDRVMVMDDEKYFTFSGDDMPGNAGFYTRDVYSAPDKVRFKSKEKFPKKILVWMAISPKGVSDPYIGSVGGPAIDGATYIKECLSRLDKFIKEYHEDDDVIFWPDLASSHYAKKTQEWLEAHNINFVPKEANPPNVPKARPIEDFWGDLAQKVYEGGWEATTELQLKRRIRKKIKLVDIRVIQDMLKGIRSKLRKIEENGPLAIL